MTFRNLHLALFGLAFMTSLPAQDIPSGRITDWSEPGCRTVFVPAHSVVLTDFGADPSGTLPCNTAIQAALAALAGPGEIIFPAGDYLFSGSIVLPDSVILRGEVDPLTQQPLSRVLFNLAENVDGIRIAGTELAMGAQSTVLPAQGDHWLVVDQPDVFSPGDHLRLHATDDASLVLSDWALGHTGQIVEVTSIGGDTLWLGRPLRRSYMAPPTIRKVVPRRQVHLNCLALVRQDATSSQTTNVYFMNAVDCSMVGMDSRLCNYAHVNVFRSTRITIANSHFKDAHAYGSGGKGYGVLVDYGSGDCYIHQNNFDHLRHAMMVQAGANGNVFAYNRSVDPYWTGTLLPANAAGDLVLHGNYPYMNLFEGNVVQNIVIDNSHFINGPFNTFYRNRAELYGIFMNTNPASNDQNFIGNQVTNESSPFLGQYALQGSGHFTHGNQIKGTIQPPGTGEPTEASLFDYPFPSFYTVLSSVPPIRNDNWQATEALIEAQHRSVVLQRPATCSEPTYSVGMEGPSIGMQVDHWLAPVPSAQFIALQGPGLAPLPYTVHDAMGRVVMRGHALMVGDPLEIGHLAPGAYLLRTSAPLDLRLRFIKE